jgi:FAD/FMN-containing dehydrogenase
VQDVVAAVAACRKFDAPLLCRGAGTSLAGQCCNVAVVLDFTKYMNRVEELNPRARFARVQPGVVLDTLRNLAEEHQLTFGPDPSTHSRCTLGGMVGNNSCGANSIVYGTTADHVKSLRLLLADGSPAMAEPLTSNQWTRKSEAATLEGAIYRNLRPIVRPHAEEIERVVRLEASRQNREVWPNTSAPHGPEAGDSYSSHRKPVALNPLGLSDARSFVASVTRGHARKRM